ncbi:MAG: polysaccharide deacetylase family protein [Agarilytica sp.]
MAESRKIVFSFDDGPAPVEALNVILNVLQANAIKAEFYVLGREVKRHPKAAKAIVSRGHTIQNHSWSHKNLAKEDERTVRDELTKTRSIIKEITGETTSRVRPPFGAGGWPKKHDPELAKVSKELGMSIHNWDIDTEDWKTPRGVGKSKHKMLEMQLAFNKSKKILNVLMHVQHETARDLPELIKFFQEKGFSFAPPSAQ